LNCAAEYVTFDEAIGIGMLLLCIAMKSEMALRSFLNHHTATIKRLQTMDEVCRLW